MEDGDSSQSGTRRKLAYNLITEQGRSIHLLYIAKCVARSLRVISFFVRSLLGG